MQHAREANQAQEQENERDYQEAVQNAEQELQGCKAAHGGDCMGTYNYQVEQAKNTYDMNRQQIARDREQMAQGQMYLDHQQQGWNQGSEIDRRAARQGSRINQNAAAQGSHF